MARPAVRRLALCAAVFGWGARRALWANHVGMEITAAHPQNALKVPRHIDTEGFNMRPPAAATAAVDAAAAVHGLWADATSTGLAPPTPTTKFEPPPGLMSAAWWDDAAWVHRWAKASYSLSWYARKVVWPSGLCVFYPVDRHFHAAQVPPAHHARFQQQQRFIDHRHSFSLSRK
jgi:hypothetical protein